MNFYPFHIGDYAAHTRNLSLMEDLAYRRLLDACYLAERPLDGSAADVARSIGMRDHLDAVEYVLGKFFQQVDGGWINARADQEIERFRVKSEQASRAGKASAERRSNARSTQDVNSPTGAQPTITQEPLPKNQEPLPNNPETNTTPVACAPDAEKADGGMLFDQFWAAYPKKTGKGGAQKAFAKIKRPTETLALILAALEWQRTSDQWRKEGGQFIPNPQTYLNQARWNDEPSGGRSQQRVFHDLSGMDYSAGVTEDGRF